MTTNAAAGQTTFPQFALDVLDQHQETIRVELHRGFRDRREVVDWWQRAAVMTFGHIAEEWPAQSLLHDRALLRYLVGDDRVSRRARGRYHSQWVEPACNDAYNHLKTEAVERLPEDGQDPLQDIDPTGVDDPAMRPAFASLDRRQEECLQTLWGGFADRDALSAWVHSLNAASYGEIEREFARELMQDRTAVRYLLDRREQEAAIYRVRLAIDELLPAFAAAAKRLQAGEKTPQEETGATAFTDRG